jgi:hypothetical protein
LFDAAGFVAAERVAVPDCSLAQVPVAEFATVNEVGVGVDAITTEDKLNAEVDSPVIETVCPELNP